ncbi:MAG: glycosyltransferase family 39 protein [Anaerolineales bacterium]|nr:glycosyltransferase family 39 protein [Anaerolineales bacterium]
MEPLLHAEPSRASAARRVFSILRLPSVPLLWILIGAALCAASGVFLQSLSRLGGPPVPGLYPSAGWISLGFGVAAVLIGAAGFVATRISSAPDRFWSALAARLGVSPAQIPLIAGGAAFALLGAAAAGDRPRMLNHAVALLSWGAGIVLTAAGFASRGTGGSNAWKAAAWALLFGLCAFFLRITWIGLPPFSADEGLTGTDALLFLNGFADSFFRSVGFHSYPGLYFFLEAVSVSLLGRTVLALRITSAAAGALTVGLLYLAGRAFFGHRIGAVAAVLLAVSPFHIVFSRIGMNNIWDGLGYTAFIGALWQAWKSGRRNAFLLAGLALGLGQFFYAPSRLMWILALGATAAAFCGDRARFRRDAGGWAGLWAAASAAALPILFFTLARPQEAGAHSLISSVFRPGWFSLAVKSAGDSAGEVILGQLERGFGAFTFIPSAAWYRPGTPLLRPVEAALFLLGAALLLARARDPRSWLLLGWIGLFGLIGALTESSPSAQRYVGSAPGCALIAAFAVVEVAARVKKMVPAAGRAAAVLAAAAVLFAAADNLHFAFAEYLPGSRFRGKYDFAGAGVAVADGIVALLSERGGSYQVVCLTGGYVVSHTVTSETYLVPGYQAVYLMEPYGSPENPEITGARLLFVIAVEREEELARVMADFPGGSAGARYNWDGTVVFLYYDVSVPG